MLKGIVNGINKPDLMNPVNGSFASGINSPIRGGGSGIVGVINKSYPSSHQFAIWRLKR